MSYWLFLILLAPAVADDGDAMALALAAPPHDDPVLDVGTQVPLPLVVDTAMAPGVPEWSIHVAVTDDATPEPVVTSPAMPAADETGTATNARLPADPELARDAARLGGWAGLAAFTAYASKPLWIAAARRIVTLAPILLGFSRLDRGRMLQQRTRRAIMDQIQSQPAVTTTEIVASAGVAWGTAVYHLQRLERAGFVVSEREGMHKRHWDIASPEARQRKETQLLRKVTPRRIALLLHEEPGLCQEEIRDRLRLSAGSTSQQLQCLQEAGLVTALPGRRRIYHATAAMQARRAFTPAP